MRAVSIPLTSDPKQEILIPILGENYVFYINWNEYESRWFLSLAKEDGTPIFNGQAMIFNTNLFKSWRWFGTPVGSLIFEDTSRVDQEPTYERMSEYILTFLDGMSL